MWIALSTHRSLRGFHPILSRLPNLTAGKPEWRWGDPACSLAQLLAVWRTGREGGWRAEGPAVLTSPLRPALAPVLLDHGAQAPEGELLRLQHAALLHAHRRRLRCLLRQRLRLAGPVSHGPDAGRVPAHHEAQRGTRGSCRPGRHARCALPNAVRLHGSRPRPGPSRPYPGHAPGSCPPPRSPFQPRSVCPWHLEHTAQFSKPLSPLPLSKLTFSYCSPRGQLCDCCAVSVLLSVSPRFTGHA